MAVEKIIQTLLNGIPGKLSEPHPVFWIKIKLYYKAFPYRM